MAVTCVPVDLSPACVNIAGVRAGDANCIRMLLRQGGVPIDLTGQALSAQARKTVLDETSVINGSVTVIDPDGGEVTLCWPGDEVRAALGGDKTWKGVWDLQIDDPDGGDDDAVTVAEGSFEAELDVTRP